MENWLVRCINVNNKNKIASPLFSLTPLLWWVVATASWSRAEHINNHALMHLVPYSGIVVCRTQNLMVNQTLLSAVNSC